MSVHQTHILLHNGEADLTILFTNKLSEFKILLLKLNTNLRKSSSNDGIFRFTNMFVCFVVSLNDHIGDINKDCCLNKLRYIYNR